MGQGKGDGTMKEIHGIDDAVQLERTRGFRQDVLVADGDGEVKLSIQSCTHPAGLTPDRARFLAACLVQSADRVEKETPPTNPVSG